MEYANYEQRLHDFETWLSFFQEKYSKDFNPGNYIQFDATAAQIMNDNYTATRNRVNDFMPPESRINAPKIAAGVQAIILLNQPFDPPASFDDEATKQGIARVNSLFAWEVCMNIIVKNISQKITLNDSFDDKLVKFYDNPKFINLQEYHLLWCQKLTNTLGEEDKDSDELLIPYFLLSQFWQALECWIEEYLSNPTN